MSSSNTQGSIKAIFYAFGANGGIAVCKFVAAFFTGSGAMMAEAIHSLADCTNQIFLLIGIREAKRAPDQSHPMGYARVVYFWAMMVALLLFFMGGAFSPELPASFARPIAGLSGLSRTRLLHAAQCNPKWPYGFPDRQIRR